MKWTKMRNWEREREQQEVKKEKEAKREKKEESEKKKRECVCEIIFITLTYWSALGGVVVSKPSQVRSSLIRCPIHIALCHF